MQEEKKARTVASSSSSSSLDILPNSLLFEHILLQFPLKSLLKLRFVSKRWNYFLSTSEFYKLHLRRHGFTSTIVFIQTQNYTSHQDFTSFKIVHQNDDGDDVIEAEFGKVIVSDKSINDDNIRKNHRFAYYVKINNVIGSCNGLICLQIKGTNILWIWNPTTREKHRVNGPRGLKGSILRSGFGYDSSSDQFKILLVYGSAAAYLFTSSDQAWKRLDSSEMERGLRKHRCMSLCAHGTGDMPVLIGETLHWLIKSTSKQIMILTFDFKTDSFTFASLSHPKSYYKKKNDVFLCEIGQCLCACVAYSKKNNDSYYDDDDQSRAMCAKAEVWKLEQHGEDPWKKLFTLNSVTLFDYIRSMNRWCSNIFEYRDQTGRLLIRDRSNLWDKDSIAAIPDYTYNPKTLPLASAWPSAKCAFSYTESLISPSFGTAACFGMRRSMT